MSDNMCVLCAAAKGATRAYDTNAEDAAHATGLVEGFALAFVVTGGPVVPPLSMCDSHRVRVQAFVDSLSSQTDEPTELRGLVLYHGAFLPPKEPT